MTPAADLPKKVGKNGDLVIVNLQKTPLDSCASLRIHGRVDIFMQKVLKHLNLEVKGWKLSRRLSVVYVNKNVSELVGKKK